MLGSNKLKLAFLLLLMCPTRRRSLAEASPPRNDWSSLDLDALDEEWEAGDDAEESADPGDTLQPGNAVMMFATLRDKDEGVGWDWDSMAKVCGDWSVRALPLRVFFTRVIILPYLILCLHVPSFQCPILCHAQDKLAHALVEITCYPIEPTGADGNASILVTTDKRRDGEGVYRFLTEHPNPRSIVSEVEWK